MENEKNSSDNESLQNLKRLASVGNLTARALKEAGFDSVSELEKTGSEELQSIEHIGVNLAENILEDVKHENLEEVEDGAREKLEMRCPVCENFTKVEENSCKECEESIEPTSRVVVPDKGFIENPIETLAAIEEKILFDEEDAESWFIRGSILESIGANRKALESFDRVIELDPLFDHIWNAKANVSLKLGETSEAAKAYKLAFDSHQGPSDIMSTIEEREASPSKEKKDLEEIDEIDEELDEKISKARELLGGIKGRDDQLSELLINLDRVTEERTGGDREKALKMVEKLIQRSEALLEFDDELQELEEEIEKIENKDLKSRAESDFEEIQDQVEKKNYIDVKRLLANLQYSLEFEKKKLEEKRVSEEKMSKIIGKLNDLSEELTDETDGIIGLSESISRAKDFKEEGSPNKGLKEVEDYLENEPAIKGISKNIDKIETMKMSLENLGFEHDFLDDIEDRFEKGKRLCENSEYRNAEQLYNEILKDIETEIEESVEDVEEELEIRIQEMERLIEKGEEKGIDIGDLKDDYEEFKEGLNSGEGSKDFLKEINETIAEGKDILAFRSNISQIEEKINEGGEDIKSSKYEEVKKELEKTFEEEYRKIAIEKSSELKEELENKIEQIQKKKELKSKVESKLAEARKKLSELRKTDFDISRMKMLLKKSNQARKKGEVERSLELTKKFIESADQILELSEPVEKAKSLVEQLAEKDLIEEDRINYEIEQYERLVEIEKYEMSRKKLRELIKELERALEEENKIPPPGDEFDKSSTQIPTQIKEKVRNVKELNNLVEKADIEIEVNREPLKEAIIKIKDIEYEEANEILNEWKDKLITRLNHKLGDKVDEMSEEIEDIDPPNSVKKRGNTIFRETREKWERGEYEEALQALISATEFIGKVSEKENDQDKEIFVMKKILEDLEELRYGDGEIDELFDELKDKKEDVEEFEKNIEELKEKIKKRLKVALKKESKNLEKRVEGLNKRELVVALSNFLDLRSDLKNDNPEGAAWVGREYIKTIEQS
ncbi:MAG: hypothetical protein ACLFSM_03260 [Thermoplasmata archaeon]